MNGNIFFLRAIPERRKRRLTSAVHRLADEKQDARSRTGACRQESHGAHAGIDHTSRPADCRNGFESGLKIAGVERFHDSYFTAVSNYSGLTGFADKESVYGISRSCDERHIVTDVLVYLDNDGNRDRRITHVQGCGLNATVIEDAKIGVLQIGKDAAFPGKYQCRNSHQPDGDPDGG
jgi:hypothetical protein